MTQFQSLLLLQPKLLKRLKRALPLFCTPRMPTFIYPALTLLAKISLFWSTLSSALVRLVQILRLPRVAVLVSCMVACPLSWALSSVVQTDQVKAELISFAPQGLNPGKSFWLGLRLTHQPEWHTYWKNPGDSGLPTQLSWSLPKGMQAKEPLWPTPKKLYVSNLTNYGFEGKVLLVTPISIAPGTQMLGSSVEIGLHANWLICRQECVPQEGEFRLQVPVKSSSALDASEFLSVTEHQPIELSSASHAKQLLEIKGNTLVGSLSGVPKDLSGLSFSVFPELPEIIADPKPRADSLSGQTRAESGASPISLLFNLHPMRSSEPSELGALIVFQTPLGERPYHATFQIKGAWPKPQPLQLSTNIPVTSQGERSQLSSSVSSQSEDSKSPQEPQVSQAPQGSQKNKGFMSLLGSYPFIAALLGALIGGMILNLMPCVLPILAIKVLSLAAHSGDVRLYRRHSAGYALGVVFCFSLFGALVVGLKTIGLELGWGFQLQSPVAVGVLTFLFLLIALNLLDVFQIHFVIPNRLISIQSKDAGVDGFLSGLLSVVVAAPCTAPFMGASLGWAVTAANLQGLLIFVFLGLGMALPIVAISYAPALGRLLPKPGEWMNTMRVFLAFPMLLTVTWLLWVFAQQQGINQMTILLVALITFSALIFSTKLMGRSKGFGILFFSLLLIFEFMVGQSLDPTLPSPTTPGMTPSTNTAPSYQPKLALVWESWSPELVAQTLAQGRPVFVDFTAAWCITCQLNERTTLQNETVKALLISKNVRLLRADWTQPNAQIASALAALGRSGIPVYLLLSPQNEQTMLSELLNPEDLIRAINGVKGQDKI